MALNRNLGGRVETSLWLALVMPRCPGWGTVAEPPSTSESCGCYQNWRPNPLGFMQSEGLRVTTGGDDCEIFVTTKGKKEMTEIIVLFYYRIYYLVSL